MRAGRRGWRWAIVVVPVLVVLAAIAVVSLRRPPTVRPAGCVVTVDAASYTLDLSQAANAATISAVAIRLGLSDHAVSIALATALQESKLHNLEYGDRDSVGLFQQRPSQGWGSRSQILDPHYSATAFFSHLGRVRGWQTMPVSVAAQAVQRSAAGSAYADWEPAARAIARALTGEVPHGIACYFPKSVSSSRGLSAALLRDTGSSTMGRPVPAKSGWLTASWLIAQAAQYDVDTVSFGGQRWTRSSGRWSGHTTDAGVTYTLAQAAHS
jgi:hypothetical protein